MAIKESDRVVVETILDSAGRSSEALIPVLQAIQGHFRYLPEDVLRYLCAHSGMKAADVESVATFFSQFRRRPVGEHIISVCDGTACHVKGAPAVYDALARRLSLAEGEDTDAEGLFTLQKVSCLGCCTLAPAVQIDGVTYGHVRPDGVSHMLADFLEHEQRRAARAGEPKVLPDGMLGEIRVGLGSCCVAGGSEKVRAALAETLGVLGVPVRVKHVSCVGMCHHTPLLEVVKPGLPPTLYSKVQPEDVEAIVTRHFTPPNPVVRMRAAVGGWLGRVYSEDGRGVAERRMLDTESPPVAAFLTAQRRLATEYCGEIDPLDIEEYQRLQGFEALRACLKGASGVAEAIIEKIRQAGLRGRGGAGFPTAVKWQAVREAPGEPKYLVCNGDEGDPGAFMDRMILESYPFRVVEGLLIASLAVGAHEGILYIRAEYPLAVLRVRAAIRRCEEEGFLGENILGSGHTLHLRVMEGAGAFVCGEETGLIASLEGRRGAPTYRPPYPAQQGLHGCPTLVNNVETLALVPWILRTGGEAFAELGTGHSKGTKVFSLAGKVARGGLIEVPMGMTIRQVVEDIGGGVADGRVLKAVQVGGPSGGCIPAAHGDTPVDYEALTKAGAMMGSGGFVVLDDSDCMVEMTRYFLSFTQRESCGKCTPCRVGTRQMLALLDRLCAGKGEPADVARLERLAEVVKAQSLCGLGKTAPNPVITALRYFREEFEAHAEGRCPAGKCRALITYTISDTCIGCTKCAQACPVDAIRMKPYERHEIDPALCTRCDTCRQTCPVGAVEVV